MAAIGVLTNMVAAYSVAKVNVNMLRGVCAVMTAISLILISTALTVWTYWTAEFFAMISVPIKGDGETLAILEDCPGEADLNLIF